MRGSLLDNLRLNLNRKIRVAHIITGIGTGGAGEDTLITIEGFDNKKYHIDLVIGEELRKDILKRIINKKINLIQIRPFKARHNFLYDPILLLKLIGLFIRGRYDIVHTHETKPGILGRIAARIAGVPIIIHGLHGNALEVFDSKFINVTTILLERITSKFTDAHISVSGIVSKKYLKYGIGKRTKYFTVRSGMELNKFFNAKENFNDQQKRHELGLTGECFIIGNVGRLEASKGHRFLFQSIKEILKFRKSQPIKLLVIGEGRDKEKLIKYAKNLNIEKNVIFTGYRKDVSELMTIMDLFVFTSLREGLPRVLVQAAAVGIPLIAFKVDGVSEILKDNYNGFLVEPTNIKQLVERIIKYIDNKGLISMHGKNGQNIVRNRWSVEGMVRRTDQIYSYLVEKKINNNKI
jgi:glycosyltransferase involved in cell wall biosynthesis